MDRTKESSGQPETRGGSSSGRRGSEPLRNEFSWSRSRARVFEECARRYYYTYYGSWGGWEDDAAPRARQLYVLKQLKTRHIWAGDVVHRTAERVLRDLKQGVTLPREEEMVTWALATMRDGFKSSRDQRYWQRPKSLALFEHQYDVAVSDETWKELAEHVGECIRNFFRSDVYSRLKSFPADDFLEIEKLSTFTVGGIKVWVKLDCCLQAEPGVFVIDWKTGRSDREEHAEQLASYALYAAQRWGVEPRYIQTLVYNLALGEGRTYQITEDTVSRAREEIVESAGRMQALLTDVARNVPVAEEDFELTDDERVCRYCNFRQACPRFIDS